MESAAALEILEREADAGQLAGGSDPAGRRDVGRAGAGNRRQPERHAERGRQLARHALVAQQVGPVRRDSRRDGRRRAGRPRETACPAARRCRARGCRRAPGPGRAPAPSRACPRTSRPRILARLDRHGPAVPAVRNGRRRPGRRDTSCLQSRWARHTPPGSRVPLPSFTAHTREAVGLGMRRTRSRPAPPGSRRDPAWSGSTASTGAPSIASRFATSRASSGRRRKSSSQRRETFMTSPPCACPAGRNCRRNRMSPS